MTISNSLTDMLLAYKQRERFSNREIGTRFRISPSTVGKIESGSFESHISTVLTDKKRRHTWRSLAGTVSRIARGCGESEKEWLHKLGFPSTVVPERDKRQGGEGITLTEHDLLLLLRVVKALGPITLEKALEVLKPCPVDDL
ncbi:hypothetical protein HZC00_04845 [Candidatus Kaiserbacteria bacterium]|nr:hypothetical protein [Candidatus Kaiserbacteria bacterium]